MSVWTDFTLRTTGDLETASGFNTDVLGNLQYLFDSLIPPGTLAPFAGVTAPTNWLLADGAAVSRSTYSALLGAITIAQSGTRTSGNPAIGLASTTGMAVGQKVEGTGIPAGATISVVNSGTQITLSANATSSGTSTVTVFPHGSGDGSTTFNVPDTRGRTIVGRGTGAGLTARALGVALGEESHALTIAELAAHDHSVKIGTQSADGTGGGSGVSTTGTPIGSTMSSTGSGTAHNNMQPSLTLTHIVKC